MLWRRIPPWHFFYDANLGRTRPSSPEAERLSLDDTFSRVSPTNRLEERRRRRRAQGQWRVGTEQRTDAELVRRVRSGDKQAFDALVTRYLDTARRVAMGMVAN